MQPLSPADEQCLREADGWLRLGDLNEVESCLAHLTVEAREHPEALQVRWTLAARRGDWAQCLSLAGALTRRAPDRRFGWLHLALSLHRLGRTAEAYDHLLAASAQFEPNPTFPLFLARFACALGRLNDGRKWLREALLQAERQGHTRELRRRVREEPELRELWPLVEGD